MRFRTDYDLIQINAVKRFAVLFFDEIFGVFFDPLNVEIEVGHFCSNAYIQILKDPMIRVSEGNYTYETLITAAVYPVNQIFFVKYTGEHPITGDPILKEEKFRTIGAPILPQANVVNYRIDPASNVNTFFDNGTNI